MEASDNKNTFTQSQIIDTAITQLKEQVDKKGLSFIKLAEDLGIARQTVSKKLNRQASISIDEFFNLASRIGINPIEVLNRAYEKQKPHQNNEIEENK